MKMVYRASRITSALSLLALSATFFLTTGDASAASAAANPRVAVPRPSEKRHAVTSNRVEAAAPVYQWLGGPDCTIDRMELRLDEQKIYAYQGGEVIAWSTVSSGKDGHDTPPGMYAVKVREKMHLSNLYGWMYDASGAVVNKNANSTDPVPPGGRFEGASMPFFLRLSDTGIGLHAGYLPGYAASHGCIRLPDSFAEAIFNRVKVGTPVKIVSNTKVASAEPVNIPAAIAPDTMPAYGSTPRPSAQDAAYTAGR